MNPYFAAVADDDTGATDLAGMLAEEGLRVVLVIDTPEEAELRRWSAACDAVVAGTGTRALTPPAAYAKARQAVRALAGLGPRMLQIKYCSTFDSGGQGNIGPSIDAAMDELAVPFTVAVPALPVNGRTTYLGHHFVGRQLLSESPMRSHPLTPMSDPDLVRHLQKQTARRVGLAPLDRVRAGADSLRACFVELQQAGTAIAVVDCTSQDDLAVIAEAVTDLPLISGSSGPAMALPRAWRRQGWTPAPAARHESAAPAGTGVLIVAGSCSEATRIQNEAFEYAGGCSLVLDPLAPSGSAAERACAVLRAGGVCLLRTDTGEAARERVRGWAAEQGLEPDAAGRFIAGRVAGLAGKVFAGVRPEGLIVAGGETSGAVSRALSLEAFLVGRNIEPGVPLCRAMGAREGLGVVFKSGNFGGPDFYGKAVAAIRGGPRS